ncbi:MAG: hypothetical protein QGH25_11770 [Candidatus Latescibacteria bacterium]|jgi:hypothetical protein|nr:hypothetical protein [Candidatus Latescibacterota bacterium]
MLPERSDIVRWGDVPMDMTRMAGRFERSAFNVYYAARERGMADIAAAQAIRRRAVE